MKHELSTIHDEFLVLVEDLDPDSHDDDDETRHWVKAHQSEQDGDEMEVTDLAERVARRVIRDIGVHGTYVATVFDDKWNFRGHFNIDTRRVWVTKVKSQRLGE